MPSLTRWYIKILIDYFIAAQLIGFRYSIQSIRDLPTTWGGPIPFIRVLTIYIDALK
jgi:hypothetical protein